MTIKSAALNKSCKIPDNASGSETAINFLRSGPLVISISFVIVRVAFIFCLSDLSKSCSAAFAHACVPPRKSELKLYFSTYHNKVKRKQPPPPKFILFHKIPQKKTTACTFVFFCIIVYQMRIIFRSIVIAYSPSFDKSRISLSFKYCLVFIVVL